MNDALDTALWPWTEASCCSRPTRTGFLRGGRRMKASLIVLLVATMLVLLPLVADAQMLVSDTRRSTELSIVHEWFHRELEPAVYDDTEWNITSLQLSYSITDWFKFAIQGGYSEFENEDFATSEYKRYSVGGGIAVH